MFPEEFIEKVGQKGIHPAGGTGRLPAEGALLTSPQDNLLNFGLLVGKYRRMAASRPRVSETRSGVSLLSFGGPLPTPA